MTDLPDLTALREKAEDELWSVTGWWPGPRLNAYFEAADTLQGENERLREALQKYGVHQPVEVPSRTLRAWQDCPAFYDEKAECWCGLSDALSVSPAEKTHP